MISPARNHSGVEDKTPTYFTIEDFGDRVRNGEFTNEDGVPTGFGYFANEEKISSVKVDLIYFTDEKYHSAAVREQIVKDGGFPPQVNLMADGSHVAWFTN